MRTFSITPREFVMSAWRHRELLSALIRRDVAGRYQGSVMGLFWSLFHPLLMLAVYTFVFGLVFRARWEGVDDSRAAIALVLFAGLMVFSLFSECVNRAPTLILSNVNFVKKVIFPLEIMPWVALGSALFHFAVSLMAWCAFHIVFLGPLKPAMIWLPLLLAPFAMLTLGICWVLASLGVYLRDVTQVVGITTTALMFLSPIFFPLSALPPDLRPYFFLNPLTVPIEQVRTLLLGGHLPPLGDLLLNAGYSAVIAWLGFVWFQKTRKGFADVL